MPIDTNFSFNHLPKDLTLPRDLALTEDLALTKGVLDQSVLDTVKNFAPFLLDKLGPLRDLVGTAAKGNAQRTWTGKGFNMIWRPNNTAPADFFLELNLTQETLSFTDITGATGIANRALKQDHDVFLGGMAYTQAIDDRFDGTGQHFETGVWINVPETSDPKESATVTRMGSIPHGTTVNLQGRTFQAPHPLFQPASIVPFKIGHPDQPVTVGPIGDAMNLAKPSPSRTQLDHVADLTQAQLSNPNLFLSQAIEKQTIVGTTVIQIASATKQGTVPDAGGGVANIAFLVGKPPTGPNADVPTVTATFWIERVRDAAGKETLQLQYTQTVLLNFSGLSWPHVTVATLTPATLTPSA